MAGPTINIGQNEEDSHQRNPSWCVAFVRFEEPTSMFSSKGLAFKETSMIVAENDCVAVNINRPKDSFAKTASVTMKIGQVYYKNAVAPGDWVFIWMSDWQADIDKITIALRNLQNASQRELLNNWDSGLKFIGRVIEADDVDSIAVGGVRTLTQTIHCQAFLELATSIYYTFAAQNAYNPFAGTQKSGVLSAEEQGQVFLDRTIQSIKKRNQAGKASNGMGNALTNLSEKFLEAYKNQKEFSPDTVIALLFIIIMGIERDQNIVNAFKTTGTHNDAIGIPKSVSAILNRPTADKLWKIYNINLGLQTYKEQLNEDRPWESLNPIFDDTTGKVEDGVFYKTPIRCKGFVPYMYPPIWNNESMWNILSQYLNPVVNEIYTAIRVNREGKILPSLIVREKPFSTQLYKQLLRTVNNKIKKKIKEETKDKDQPLRKAIGANKKKFKVDQYDVESNLGEDLKERTFYNNIPRWKLSESMIKSVNTKTSESKRINFVQVWGQNKGLSFAGFKIDPQEFLVLNFLNGNYLADEKDISRHGLRADITETQFDTILPANQDKKKADKGSTATLSPVFARMRGDWLFNGHLKPFGSVTCNGIKEPICEGDNLEIRGVLYHIDNINFSGSIGANGQKSFTTTIAVSNGILADSLENKNTLPSYPISYRGQREAGEHIINDNYSDSYELPGVTDIQITEKDDRDSDGDPTKKDKK